METSNYTEIKGSIFTVDVSANWNILYLLSCFANFIIQEIKRFVNIIKKRRPQNFCGRRKSVFLLTLISGNAV